MSSPGCQSKTLLVHLFSGRENDSSCHSPIHSSVYFNPARDFLFFHVFFGFFGASFDVFDPVFFVFSGIYFFIDLLLKRYVAVLIFVRALLRTLFSFFVGRTFFVFFNRYFSVLIFFCSLKLCSIFISFSFVR